MGLYTKTVGRSHREYIYTRYRTGSYQNRDEIHPVWQIDRMDHHLPAWRGALCFSAAAAQQEGGPTERDFLYGPFYLEAEGSTYEVARDTIVAAVGILMRDFGIPLSAMRFMYSGNRSPWVFIEPGVFGVLPSARLPEIYGSMARDLAALLGPRFRDRDGKCYLDTSIYSWNQIRRATNSRHPSTNLYAVPLTWTELRTLGGNQVRAMATGPRFMAWTFGAAQESLAAGAWYQHHVRKTYMARRTAEIEAERRRRSQVRAPRFFTGLRKFVQALLHIESKVPVALRNHAVYGIALAFRDAGYSAADTYEAVLRFYEDRCERHPAGEDDGPRDLQATVRSAFSERRRFSERRFGALFGALVQRSQLPEVVKIPRAEMDRLFKLRASSADWRAFFREWARQESPASCRSYVMLDRNFVDITLPRLEDGSLKTFAYLLYSSTFQRTRGGQGRWAYRVHDLVSKETVCRRLGLRPGTVGRHLAILRQLRVLVGQMLNPLPIPLTTVRLPVSLQPAPASVNHQTEDAKSRRGVMSLGSQPSVTSFRGGHVGPLGFSHGIKIPLRSREVGLGSRRRLVTLALSRARRLWEGIGVEVDPEGHWPFGIAS